MSLKYFARYRFNGSDVAEEDYGLRDLAVESGNIDTIDDATYGSCLALNGMTSLLSTGSFTNIADDTDRCFSFWAKTNPSSATNPDPSPVLCYGELASPNAFVLYANNSTGYPEHYDYQSRNFSNSLSIQNNTWTFFAFSCKAQELKIYVDGNLNFTTNLTLTTGTSDPLRIGTDAQGEYFDGCLLDLRMWESALEGSVVEYMYSVGPNFEEELPTRYAEESRSSVITGNLLCRTTYGVQTTGSDLTESFFCVDENSEPQEAVRIEHSQDNLGVASQTVRVRHDASLEKTIEISPVRTTFSTTDANSTSSVIFSADGVEVVAAEEKGCIFFGAGRDFRIRVGDGSFLVEAFSSAADDYVKKMEISS